MVAGARWWQRLKGGGRRFGYKKSLASVDGRRGRRSSVVSRGCGTVGVLDWRVLVLAGASWAGRSLVGGQG